MKHARKIAGVIIVVVAMSLGGCSKSGPTPLDQSAASSQLKHFIAEKKAQASAAATADGRELQPEIEAMFAAAEKGDWLTISNIFQKLYPLEYTEKGSANGPIPGTEWQTTKEIWGAFDCLASDPPLDRYFVTLGQDIIASVPRGSIYFGGSDPGRWTVTALQASQVKGKPFFTLTQNALVDPGYLDYLRGMYGGKIYVPTANDSQQCFSDYMEDAQKRLYHDQHFTNEPREIKPGEEVSTNATGRLYPSGQVAVMAVNAFLAKVIFDHETNREFYVEESFPLDWMYPHLEPHGLIMKLNREQLAELPDDIIRKDHEFWSNRVAQVIGDWLKDDTSVSNICAFERKVYLKHDFSGFKGDPRFVTDDWPGWISTMRSAIAGIYIWRTGINPSGGVVPPEYVAKAGADHDQMIREADFACRQAFALAPGSPQAVYRYVNFLVNQKPIRIADAIAVAEVGLDAHEGDQYADEFRALLKPLRDIQRQVSTNPPAN